MSRNRSRDCGAGTRHCKSHGHASKPFLDRAVANRGGTARMPGHNCRYNRGAAEVVSTALWISQSLGDPRSRGAWVQDGDVDADPRRLETEVGGMADSALGADCKT